MVKKRYKNRVYVYPIGEKYVYAYLGKYPYDTVVVMDSTSFYMIIHHLERYMLLKEILTEIYILAVERLTSLKAEIKREKEFLETIKRTDKAMGVKESEVQRVAKKHIEMLEKEKERVEKILKVLDAVRR